MSARAKRMEVITGDLPSESRNAIDDKGDFKNDLPSLVDDLLIFGQDVAIEGLGTARKNVVGQAHPLWTRTDATSGKTATVNVKMQ